MKQKIKVKSVCWSYPSSVNSRQLGFEKIGCYTVSLGSPGRPEDAVKGFATIQEAKAFADTLPLGWSKCTL